MLGVCYYPEHWREEKIREDVLRMRDLGIEKVRVGEFAWSYFEPRPGEFRWQRFDTFFQLAQEEGLQVIFGTPTATPPRWLIDRDPTILPLDKGGRVRKFGSRRHYCFSHPGYREEVRRIVTLLGERYGERPALVGWQTDNEYGCHDTVRCYCDRCKMAFREWLKERYGDIDTLNQAWGTVFWSQRYNSFDEIELPNLIVTEPNPSHLLDYFRFASHQVVLFNRSQVEILRKLSPGRFITHNCVGGFTDFDHFALSEDLDFITWDSYPLGHALELSREVELGMIDCRVGHPDLVALVHDLYRGVGRGRFGVMEQQVGPVNWAPYNTSPRQGMVRLWTWEAIAHGAELVSYFRWRQVPFAQEQMHSGLLCPDSTPCASFEEVKKVSEELQRVSLPPTERGPIALLFDYEAAWVFGVQPHGERVFYSDLVFRFYTALRRLGFDIDILPQGASLKEYKLVVVPSLPIVSERVLSSLQGVKGMVVFGPRSGSKTENFHIPSSLPPGLLQAILPLRVTGVESLPPLIEKVYWRGKEYPAGIWREWVYTSLQPEMVFGDGKGAAFRKGNYYYLAFWPEVELLVDFFERITQELGLCPVRLPDELRIRRRGNLIFAFNFGSQALEAPVSKEVSFIIGEKMLPPCEVAVWKEERL